MVFSILYLKQPHFITNVDALMLRFGGCSDSVCLQHDDILVKSMRDVSRFASVAFVDVESEDVQVYVKYFDITLFPSTIFFFNAHHMKLDSGTADHTKWVGAFHLKQYFIDVVRGNISRSYEREDDCSLSDSARESTKIRI